MDQQLTLDVSGAGDIVTIRVTGELDVAVAPELTVCVVAQIEQGFDHVVLDLAGLRFCDSTGISTFVGLSKQLYSRGGWLRLENVSGSPRQVLELTGVYELLTSPTTAGEPSWSLDGLEATS